jgi:hypothetical protein
MASPHGTWMTLFSYRRSLTFFRSLMPISVLIVLHILLVYHSPSRSKHLNM